MLIQARYGDQKEYATFKRSVHEALHHYLGDNAPSVPHARTWFPEDNNAESTGTRRRRNNTTDNTNNDEDEDEDDDEIEISGATVNLKCPLTLQTFKEPYSNNVCSHTFEKFAFIDYFNGSAVHFPEPSQRGRGQQATNGPKKAKCPQSGCEKVNPRSPCETNQAKPS